MLLQHFLFFFRRVFVLETEELTARLEVHSLDEVCGLGCAQAHQGVDIHVVCGREHLEKLIVCELVDELKPPCVSYRK